MISQKDKFILLAANKVNKDFFNQWSSNIVYSLGFSFTEEKLVIILSDIPNEYLSDFVRGYFDKSGCVTKIRGNRINSIFYCENKIFIDFLWKILKEKAGVKSGSYNPVSNCLKFGNRDSIKIGEYMYKNNPELFLERKRIKFNRGEN